MMNVGAQYVALGNFREDFQIRLLKLSLVLFPLAFIALLVWLKLNHPWLYSRDFMKEDGPIEWATSIAYLLAGGVCAFLSIRFYKNEQRLFCLLYALLAVGLFFIFGEEISWGQRIFGEQTPQFFAEHNIQDETNLHNMLGPLSLDRMYILVGLYGSLSRLLTPSSLKRRFPMVLNLLTPNYFLVLFFFPCFALYVYYDYLSVALVHWFGPQVGYSTHMGGYVHDLFMRSNDQEPIEFLMSLGFLSFVIINAWRYSIGRPAQRLRANR